MRFSKLTQEKLGHYVYAIVDPKDDKIFYVGKASKNNRAFEHLKTSKDESEKKLKIDEIRSQGNEPRIDILRHGLVSSEVALHVEAAIIDSLGLENLTNLVRGHNIVQGRIHASEAQILLGSTPIKISNINYPCMMFYIHNTFSPTMSEQEIYDCVRQFWSGVSKENRVGLQCKIALGMVDGVVVRVYKIISWHKAGDTMSTRTLSPDKENRWEFVGQLLKEHELTGKTLLNDDGERLLSNQKGYGYIR